MISGLKRLQPSEIPSLRRAAVEPDTLVKAAEILRDVQQQGEKALLDYSERFGDLKLGERLLYKKEQLEEALTSLPTEQREVLERVAGRIRRFATAQRESIRDLTCAIEGGEAGHRVTPVEVAGCYAPGGRFPLPSSVLMTAVTARVAGVETVWVASPRPTQVTLAAAAIAGADALVAAGGAQAIAAFAYGAGEIPVCDTIVGPGNKWVTAAKQLVSGHVGIDMLAGPSELVILADGSASASLLAADLLAQAEHDTEALPILLCTDAALLDEVDRELMLQMETLSTVSTASISVPRGFSVHLPDLETGVELCNRLAPEHLEVLTEDPRALMGSLRHFGGLFLGRDSAEVLGDYGAGPNHTLPTGGTARSAAGLSVIHFLRLQTWMHISDLKSAQPLVQDSMALATMEGLEGHRRSAEHRWQEGEN